MLALLHILWSPVLTYAREGTEISGNDVRDTSLDLLAIALPSMENQQLVLHDIVTSTTTISITVTMTPTRYVFATIDTIASCQLDDK